MDTLQTLWDLIVAFRFPLYMVGAALFTTAIVEGRFNASRR